VANRLYVLKARMLARLPEDLVEKIEAEHGGDLIGHLPDDMEVVDTIVDSIRPATSEEVAEVED
jgi:hypothetical protein